MKNSRIVKAWNTVNPTVAQKRRMRSALEAQLSGRAVQRRSVDPAKESRDLSTMDFTIATSDPEKQRESDGKDARTEKRKPKYQSAQPAKPRTSVFALMAAMLALVITGALFLGMMTARSEEPPSYAAPSQTETVPTTQPTQLPEAYRDVIQKYVTAIEEGWNPEKCSQNEMSLLIGSLDSPENVGYALRDVDGDGMEELLITDGDLIYDLYTMSSQGEIYWMASSMERDRFYLSNSNHIAEVGSSSAMYSDYSFYTISWPSSAPSLFLVDRVIYDANTDPENPWFKGKDLSPISEENANDILNDMYFHLCIPRYTLSGEGPYPEEVLPEEAVLKQYAQKLSDLIKNNGDWTIQHYCFYDFDGNGESELLLGANNALYAVLTQGEEGSVQVNSVIGLASIYFCEDGVTERVEKNQGHTSYQYERVDGTDVDYVSTDGESWYTQDGTAISREEAETIREKYQRLNLPWKIISDFPVPIPAASGEYISTLFNEVFFPIAAEGKKITDEELKNKLKENVLSVMEQDGLISCTDPEIPGAGLTMLTADASGYSHGPMTYTLPGTVGRFVEVRWDEDTVHYRKGTDTYHNTYAVDSAEELRDFLTADEENMLLLKAAETYAEKYFASAAAKMREEANQGSSNKLHSWDYQYEIRDLRGTETTMEEYTSNGFVEVTAEALLNQSESSCDYLTMKLRKENGEWKVVDSWLEK